MLEFLSERGVFTHLRASTKKLALHEMARRAAEFTGVHERTILDVLLERERLGTTGVGKGVAIPHGRLSALPRVHGLFARLERPIDFDSIDGQPVDLIFMLLVPESAGAAHLRALARVSRLLRDERLCARLRGCDSASAILALLGDSDTANAA
jgi:PTS system nitrogen regulatory IIA component